MTSTFSLLADTSSTSLTLNISPCVPALKAQSLSLVPLILVLSGHVAYHVIFQAVASYPILCYLQTTPILQDHVTYHVTHHVTFQTVASYLIFKLLPY